MCRAPMAWVHADASSKRLDEKYLVRQRVQMPLPHLASVLSQVRNRFCCRLGLRFCLIQDSGQIPGLLSGIVLGTTNNLSRLMSSSQ